jgi:hypothetical protein
VATANDRRRAPAVVPEPKRTGTKRGRAAKAILAAFKQAATSGLSEFPAFLFAIALP